jgi:ribonuclease P protein component
MIAVEEWMKRTVPLRMNYEFSRVYKRGRFLTGGLVVIHYLKHKSPDEQNRLGVTASRGISGSVCRNRVKRLLRESYRLQEDQLCFGYDLVITGRQRDPLPTFAQIDRELGRLLSRAGIRKPLIVQTSDTASGTCKTLSDHPALQDQEHMLSGENR